LNDQANSNIALNFLFKNKDMGELIKQKSGPANLGIFDVDSPLLSR